MKILHTNLLIIILLAISQTTNSSEIEVGYIYNALFPTKVESTEQNVTGLNIAKVSYTFDDVIYAHQPPSIVYEWTPDNSVEQESLIYLDKLERNASEPAWERIAINWLMTSLVSAEFKPYFGIDKQNFVSTFTANENIIYRRNGEDININMHEKFSALHEFMKIKFGVLTNKGNKNGDIGVFYEKKYSSLCENSNNR